MGAGLALPPAEEAAGVPVPAAEGALLGVFDLPSLLLLPSFEEEPPLATLSLSMTAFHPWTKLLA